MPNPVVPDPDRWTDMEAGLHTWRRAHPEATWVEIETEIDRRLVALRADLLKEVATDLPVATERCPDCGGPLVSRGAHPRTVVTHGDQAVRFTRSYQTCTVCGAGLFPPSMNDWGCTPKRPSPLD